MANATASNGVQYGGVSAAPPPPKKQGLPTVGAPLAKPPAAPKLGGGLGATKTPGLGSAALSMGKSSEDKEALLAQAVGLGLRGAGAVMGAGRAAMSVARPLAQTAMTAMKPAVNSMSTVARSALTSAPVQRLRTAGTVAAAGMTAGATANNMATRGQDGKRVLASDGDPNSYLLGLTRELLAIPVDNTFGVRMKLAEDAVRPLTPHELGAFLFHTLP